MNCPKCGHPEAECIIGNYWKCQGCDDRGRPLGSMNRLASTQVPTISGTFKSDDPTAMHAELLDAVKEFEASNNCSPRFVNVRTGTYDKISEALGYRPEFIRAAKVRTNHFMAHEVYIVN